MPEPDLTHDAALQAITDRIAGDGGPAAVALRALLPLHVAKPTPTPGRPDPDCTFCSGVGRVSVSMGSPRVVACGCAWPTCVGCCEALIGNRPCRQVGVMFEAVIR